MREIHIRLGEFIDQAICQAVAEANDTQQTGWFSFNGERVIVSPGDAPEQLLRQWDRRHERRAREFQASPAYVEKARKEAVRLCALQVQVNTFLDASEITPLTPYSALKLLVGAADVLDNSGILVPWDELAERFGALAPAGTHVGRTDLDQPGQEQDAALWLIGQAVGAFQRGLGPRPILADFATPILDALRPLEGTP